MSITFTPVSRDEIPTASTRTSSESAKLFEAFLDSEAEVVQVNVEIGADEDATKKLSSVRSTLSNYIERHNLNVGLFTRNGALYMEKITDEQAADRKAALEAKRAARADAGTAVAGDAEVDAEGDYS